MPTYEYRCNSCSKLSSFFVRSIDSELNPVCSHCQGKDMQRLMSSSATGKNDLDESEKKFTSGFCDQCGTPIPRSSSQFCSSCGAELPAPQEQASAPPIPTPSGQTESLLQEEVDEVSPEESKSDDDKKTSFLDNPLSFIGGSTVIVGWFILPVIVLFQHNDSWLWLWGYGWSLAIAFGPIYAAYEVIYWGEWLPISVFGAGTGISTIGQGIGKNSQFNRISLGVLFCLTIYFLPFGIGLIRNKRAKLALFVLNLLGGWTGLFWIVALIWALMPRTGDTTVPVINSRD